MVASPASCPCRNGVFFRVKRNTGRLAGAMVLSTGATATNAASASTRDPAVALQILPQGGATAASTRAGLWREHR